MNHQSLNHFSSVNKKNNGNLKHTSVSSNRDYTATGKPMGTHHQLDDFDNPAAWKIKELDMLEGMGFVVEGDCGMGLTVPDDLDMNQYHIAKHRELGYELKINERKHYFRTFDEMMRKIDEFGKLEV